MAQSKESKLTKKLGRSIESVKGVLKLAKLNGGDIKTACKKMGRNKNYVNCAMFYMRAVEKKNNVKLPAVREIEQELEAINDGTAVTSSRARGSHIENAIAGMKMAIARKISIATVSKMMGKDPSYLVACFTMIHNRMNATAEQKKEFIALKDEYLRLREAGKITPTKRRKYRSSKRRSSKTTDIVRPTNALSHLVRGDVEFKYPVITDKPVTKEQKTYPLEVLEPGHAFAVPAEKGHMIAVKKAVTLFAKRNPGTKFLQKREGSEFFTWRME